eukprot:10403643-Alexandrium_andersonii.AAC.1
MSWFLVRRVNKKTANECSCAKRRGLMTARGHRKRRRPPEVVAGRRKLPQPMLALGCWPAGAPEG